MQVQLNDLTARDLMTPRVSTPTLDGFATLENIFYGRLVQKRIQSITLILIRQCTSSALHTCTTSLVGEGVAQFRVKCKGNYSDSNIKEYCPIILKKLCYAILIHAIHNYLCLHIFIFMLVPKILQ